MWLKPESLSINTKDKSAIANCKWLAAMEINFPNGGVRF